MFTPHRVLAAAALTCLTTALLTACASESPAQSIASQKQQVTALAKLVPAANRVGTPAITGGTKSDTSGSYLACDSKNRQFLTGRVVDVQNLKPQAFVESLKSKLTAQGYETKWYTASSPRKLVADKDGYEFWFGTATDKRDAKKPLPAIVITSFGKCFPVGK